MLLRSLHQAVPGVSGKEHSRQDPARLHGLRACGDSIRSLGLRLGQEARPRGTDRRSHGAGVDQVQRRAFPSGAQGDVRLRQAFRRGQVRGHQQSLLRRRGRRRSAALQGCRRLLLHRKQFPVRHEGREHPHVRVQLQEHGGDERRPDSDAMADEGRQGRAAGDAQANHHRRPRKRRLRRRSGQHVELPRDFRQEAPPRPRGADRHLREGHFLPGREPPDLRRIQVAAVRHHPVHVGGFRLQPRHRDPPPGAQHDDVHASAREHPVPLRVRQRLRPQNDGREDGDPLGLPCDQQGGCREDHRIREGRRVPAGDGRVGRLQRECAAVCREPFRRPPQGSLFPPRAGPREDIQRGALPRGVGKARHELS